MNNVSRIPEKTGTISVVANENVHFDTNGLECIIKPDGADVFVTTKDNDYSGGFIVRSGEQLDFCGKLYIYAKENCTVYFMKYRTL